MSTSSQARDKPLRPTFIDDIAIDKDINDNVVEVPDVGSTTGGHGHRANEGGIIGHVRSWVWKYFKKKEIDGEQKAICVYCGLALDGHYKHGTKHLINHHEICKQQIQLETCQQGSFDKHVCKEKVAKLVIMHELPLSFVEYEGFQELVNYVQPFFPPMSRNTLRKEIFKIFDVQKKKTMELIESSGGRIAITSDMWTTPNQKKGYMAITSHFIDRNYVLHSRMLRFIYVPCPHTTEKLAQELIDCLIDWKVDCRLSAITLDYCFTNDAMISYLKRAFKADHMILGGKLFHMQHITHILNLIVRDGLEILEEEIERIRESIAYWSSTPKRIERFESVIMELKLSYTKKLMLDCRTRWNSTYLMLTTALEYKEVFKLLSIRERQYTSCPLDAEWELAKIICEHLQVFYNVTEVLLGARFPTFNLFFPVICDLRLELTRWFSSSNVKISTMAGKMIEKFEKYGEIFHGLLAVAAVLDPRYKLDLFNFFYPRIYGEDANTYITKVRSILNELVEEYKLNVTSYGLVVVEEGSRSVGNKTKRAPFPSYDKYQQFKSHTSYRKNKLELDLYLEEDALPESDDVFDVLRWWKTNGAKYPVLSALAKDILVIPVTMVASESVFSSEDRHLSPQRSQLQPDTLEAIMCTQNWLWASSHGLIPKSQLVNAKEVVYEDEDAEPSATE